MDWVVAALDTHAPLQIHASLLETAARNLLGYDTRFQERFDLPVTKSFGWLGATHAVTFASALRELAGRNPRLWRPGLLQLACFTGRATPFVDTRADWSEWQVGDPDAFLDGALERVFDHGFVDPIYACHILKTTLAVREELGSLPEAPRAALLAALNRFLHAPIKQKHVRRIAQQALRLVGLDYAEQGERVVGWPRIHGETTVSVEPDRSP